MQSDSPGSFEGLKLRPDLYVIPKQPLFPEAKKHLNKDVPGFVEDLDTLIVDMQEYDNRIDQLAQTVRNQIDTAFEAMPPSFDGKPRDLVFGRGRKEIEGKYFEGYLSSRKATRAEVEYALGSWPSPPSQIVFRTAQGADPSRLDASVKQQVNDALARLPSRLDVYDQIVNVTKEVEGFDKRYSPMREKIRLVWYMIEHNKYDNPCDDCPKPLSVNP
jgi:hypothetical protein